MKRRWQPSPGILAIEPSAFFGWWDPFEAPKNEVRDGVAIVHVRGPLEHHHSSFADSYDDVLARVREALSASPRALVLSIDSPGGLAQGMAETARELRAACKAASVPLVAYVDGKATSAAYGLACVADEVVVPPSAIVGSIGTMLELLDVTESEEKWGVKVRVIVSGARKGDSHPSVPKSDDALAALQTFVDSLGDVFCDLVGEGRPITVDQVRALEAGIYVGAKAVDAGLADRVESFSQLIGRLTGASPENKSPAGAEESSMDEEEKKARASLQAIIDDEDADEKAKSKAKAALSALDATDEDDTEEDGKKKEGAENASRVAPVTALDARLSAIESSIAADRAAREAKERAANVKALLDARPDLSTEQRKAFEQLEPKALADVLATLPRSSRRNPAADLNATPTRGSTTPGIGARDPHVAAVKAALGLGKRKYGVVQDANSISIGAPVESKEG